MYADLPVSSMRIFLIVVGILMLVPGACGAFFTVLSIDDQYGSHYADFALVSLFAGILGILLIIVAIWRVR